MASPTRWTWLWVNSGSWWRTGRPGVLQSMGSQRVGHDWVTEQQHITNGHHVKSIPCITVQSLQRYWGCALRCSWHPHDSPLITALVPLHPLHLFLPSPHSCLLCQPLVSSLICEVYFCLFCFVGFFWFLENCNGTSPTLVSMAVIIKTRNKQVLVRMWIKGNSQKSWLGCKLEHPLWKTVWRFLKN